MNFTYSKVFEKKILIFYLFFFLCLCFLNPVFGQNATVKGHVSDEKGDALPGVTITVVGSPSIGTITDFSGDFSLQVPRASKLSFSYVGYITKEFPASNSEMKVVLLEDVKNLEEVVVIGYGTVRKSDLTGSVSSISSRQYESQPITRMDQAINGRASGVSVITNSGQPDQSIRIRIRGTNSINASNEPLYVVDGVANSNLFYNLNADDVQSIEILKDASATAIYGSRGANGVILVTTKQGITGKLQMQFSSNQSWNVLPKKIDLLNASEFAEAYNEYRKQKMGATTNFFSTDEIENFKKTGGTDWQDLIYRTARLQEYNLSLSGGNQKVQYMISGNVLDNEGLLLNSKVKRYGIRSNISADPTKWLKINLDITANRKEMNNNGSTGMGTPVSAALNYAPTLSPQDESGNWSYDNFGTLQSNPLGQLMENKGDEVSNYFGGNIKFSIMLPIKGLSVDLRGASNYRNTKGYSLSSANRDISRGNPNGASNSQGDNFDWYVLTQLNYNNKWGKHNLNAFIATEFSRGSSTSMSMYVNRLRTESVGYWNLGLGDISSYGNSYSESSLASLIGRAIYQFKDRYMFTSTFRYDGSSSFQKNKWFFFPSFALAWRASEESFIRDLEIFDLLKIRTSYGITGNQGIGIYETLGLMAQSNYGWGASTQLPGYVPGTPSNPDLSWEKTIQWDAGFDVAFFKNRLSITGDFYYKKTKDLLLDRAIPYYNGGGTSKVNLGVVKNWGSDFSFSIIPIQTKKIFWESVFNLSYTKNEVVNMGSQEQILPGSKIGDATINTAILKVGEPMGSIYGYVWKGLWRTDEAGEAAKWGQKPGDNKFKDKNGNYQLDSADAEIIGKSFPDYIFGWNNTISWKNLELNLFFQGAFGVQRLNLMRYKTSEANAGGFITYKKGWYDMWTPKNQKTKVPNQFSDTYMSRFETNQYLEDADYLRLRNISISYTIPRSKKRFGELKLILSCQNVFVITSYTGYDPELTNNTGNIDTNSGIDSGIYPIPRSYTVGLQFTF